MSALIGGLLQPLFAGGQIKGGVELRHVDGTGHA